MEVQQTQNWRAGLSQAVIVVNFMFIKSMINA